MRVKEILSREVIDRQHCKEITVFITDDGSVLRAINYQESGKFDRWCFQREDTQEFTESWSSMLELLRCFVGNQPAIEVYPKDEEIVNSLPARHFWVIDGDLPSSFNLAK